MNNNFNIKLDKTNILQCKNVSKMSYNSVFNLDI